MVDRWSRSPNRMSGLGGPSPIGSMYTDRLHLEIFWSFDSVKSSWTPDLDMTPKIKTSGVRVCIDLNPEKAFLQGVNMLN